jgi:hypothetical protein
MSQSEELERVSARIAGAVIHFCRKHQGKTFHADDLRLHVQRAVGGGAPASADRVLRDLRQRGVINYEVISRSESRYLCHRVRAV